LFVTPIGSPEESVRAGRLRQALHELQNRVRAKPDDVKDRLFLFQLLALLGQWDRASTQLTVAADLDSSFLILKQIYLQAIKAEDVRTQVFQGTSTPVILGEPPAWMGALVESVRLSAQGHFDKASELRGQALADAQATAGTINGEPFQWIADGDSRLGPCLEIILDGKYMWAPFERIRSIRIEAPTDLRDLVWTQAVAVWSNGGQTPALIPSRYVGAESLDDDTLCMSRRTEWQAQTPETFVGHGQRMFATDAGEYSLLEVREITLDSIAAVA
jgi:type VI secretion system protein ImpE